jgi:LacI family transcriptional regulator
MFSVCKTRLPSALATGKRVQQKPATITDIAREAGVSRTTVAFVLNNRPDARIAPATRRRIQETADRLRYRRNAIATSLFSGRTGSIGLVIYGVTNEQDRPVVSPYVSEMVMALGFAAASHQLRTTLLIDTPTHPLVVDELVDQRVDGLILVSLSYTELRERICATGFPYVCIGIGAEGRLVVSDDAQGIRQSFTHLYKLGHRRIAYIGLDKHPAPDHLSGTNRRQAFIQLCQEYALPRFAGNTYEDACADWGDFPTLLKLPADRRPTACVCFNDNSGVEAIRHANAAGLRVPEDFSVVGFDDLPLAQWSTPRLTTVHNPLPDQADAALHILRQQWEGKEPEDAVLSTYLVLRESTAPVST